MDTGVEEGDSIPSDFDSMIAKIIAFGRTRKEALARLQRALSGSVVVIKGGTSNRSFLMELLSRDEVSRGQVDVGWLDRLAAKGQHLSHDHADVALVQAAIEAYQVERRVEQSQFYATALLGRPQVRNEVGYRIELRRREHTYSIKVYRVGLQQYCLELDDARITAQLEPLGPFEYWLTVFGRRFHVVSVEQGSSYRIEVDGISHCIDRDDGGIVRAPSPAVVVSVSVNAGNTVKSGERLAVLEAMKMEMQVVAPFAGRVRQVIAIPNVQVSSGSSAGADRAVYGEQSGRRDRSDKVRNTVCCNDRNATHALSARHCGTAPVDVGIRCPFRTYCYFGRRSRPVERRELRL